MQVPLYFLNKNDIENIHYAFDIYNSVSKSKEERYTDEDFKSILKELKKRRYLTSNNIICVASVLVLVITSAEKMDNMYNIHINETKGALLTLIASHFELIDDDTFVENHVLFRYIYNVLSTYKTENISNAKEMETVNFLKLLQL